MSSRTSALAITLTLTIAAALRLYGLGSGLWYDEIVTLVESARLPLWQILTDFPGVNTHPLYSVLAHASLSMFGDSAWALRLPAAGFGIASVAMAYGLGRRLLGPLEALAGALLLTVSYHHIWFSQNARGYTMMGFFALLSTYALLAALDTGRRRHYLVYLFASAAGVYTHLSMAFVVAGQIIVVLAGRTIGWPAARRAPIAPFLWSTAGAAALSLGLYAPFIPGLIAHLGAAEPQEAAQVATGSWAAAEALRSLLSGAGVPAALAGGLIAAFGAISLWRRHPFETALLVMPAVVTAVTIVILGQPMRPRFFFFLSGAAAVFAGRGIGAVAEAVARRPRTEPASLPPLTIVAAITAALVVASLAGLPRNYRIPKQDFDGAVAALASEEQAGARIVAAGPACLPLEIYYRKAEWRCLRSLADLDGSPAPRTLVLYTLVDYVENRELRDYLRTTCAPVHRFPGTLGGGDLIACDPARRLPS